MVSTPTTTSTFPEIRTNRLLRSRRIFPITLSLQNSSDAHAPTDIVQLGIVTDDEDKYSFSHLGPNLSPSTHYELWRGDTIHLFIPAEDPTDSAGKCTMVYVPHGRQGTLEGRWQIVDRMNNRLRPYVPSQDEIDKVSKILQKEQAFERAYGDSDPSVFPLALSQDGMDPAFGSASTQAEVHPEFAMLVPIGTEQTQVEIESDQRTFFLLLTGLMPLSKEEPERYFTATVNSYVSQEDVNSPGSHRGRQWHSFANKWSNLVEYTVRERSSRPCK